VQVIEDLIRRTRAAADVIDTVAARCVDLRYGSRDALDSTCSTGKTHTSPPAGGASSKGREQGTSRCSSAAGAS
jgi:hypothetical protein